jgi:taurine dioxygenase
MIELRELEPFGVELDIALGNELPSEQQIELRQLYADHDLLVVREQRLTIDEQIRVMSYLGPVLRTADSIGEISRDSPIGLGGAELCFHADYAYSPEPLLGLSLHALDVVDGQTSTRFASGRRAYQGLDPDFVDRIEKVKTLQVFGARLDHRNRLHELDPALPNTAHPLIWHHKATGAPYLFAPEMTTDRIVGVSDDESENLVGQLFEALYGGDNILEHRWKLGDIVIWNQCSVMHARGDASQIEHRVLQRVATGTKGYYDLYPELADFGWEDNRLTQGSKAPGRPADVPPTPQVRCADSGPRATRDASSGG